MLNADAVINASLGGLPIGLEMAGFKVDSVYEADERKIAVHKANVDAPVTRYHQKKMMPKAFLTSICWLCMRATCSF